MITSAVVDLVGDDGTTKGTLTLACLRGEQFQQWRGLPTLIDRRDDPTFVGPAAPVQLLEEMSYGYEIVLAKGDVAVIEPADHFTSTSTTLEGRLEAKRATGTLTVTVLTTTGERLRANLEVRSRKLDYESEYRSMLLRIARESAELLQSAFAPSSLPAFRPDVLHDPETIYQRFAFIQALLDSEQLRDALHLFRKRPHVEHQQVEYQVPSGRALKASAAVAKQFVAAGPRRSVSRPVAGVLTVPSTMVMRSNEVTYDTTPNRFVKYVLTRWRGIATDVERALSSGGASDRRGRREAAGLVDTIEQLLTIPALADAGTLTAFPASNQVIQGRSGYRDIFEAFLLAESAATIDWDDANTLFRAGQRNVAELYEYWVFLELVRIVESLPGFSVDRRSLIKRSSNGISLELRREAQPVVVATGQRRGSPVTIKVWFNKSFTRTGQPDASTWTITMRPDCSIQIIPADRSLEADTWIHFDAKYRIQELDSEFNPSDGPAASGNGQVPLPADLAKMHSYRDAIRRTAGAYVLYPGNDQAAAVQRGEYHEVLPGLGAFTLRPSPTGEASEQATRSLRSFLLDVVDHIAAQGTAAERARYWTSKSYATPSARHDVDPLLTVPSADTQVLLAFVKSDEHRQWVLSTGLYNLRADPSRNGSVAIDGPELGVSLVVLYGEHGESVDVIRTEGDVTVRTSQQLLALNYPRPGGDLYLCLGLDMNSRTSRPIAEQVRRTARTCRPERDWAAPLVTTWLTVGLELASDSAEESNPNPFQHSTATHIEGQ